MYFEMCGLEMTGTKTECTLQLCSVKPLANGEAFEVIDDKEIWHPNWARSLSDSMNIQFIQAAVNRIWQNEKVSYHMSRQTRTYKSSRDFKVLTTVQEILTLRTSQSP